MMAGIYICKLALKIRPSDLIVFTLFPIFKTVEILPVFKISYVDVQCEPYNESYSQDRNPISGWKIK